MTRVAFVMEQTLGHVTHARNLRQVLDQTPTVDPCWLPIPYDVQGPARLLPLYRSNWSVRASWRARRALGAALSADPLDALFFHTQVASLFSVDLMRRIPTIISLDATPLNYDEVGVSYGHRAAGNGLIDRQKFRLNCRALQAAVALIAWSEWTKRSLVDDYGVEASRVRVLAPGAADAFFEVGRQRLAAGAGAQPDTPVRILFVGGDWERKGGPILLEALAGLPAGSWQLDVVTRAPVAPRPGIVVHHNVGPNSPELLRLFTEADLFALPSLGECLAVVLMEATAAALPVITTDVGALAEAVQPGQTGLIVPPRDVQALRAALGRLIEDGAARRGMGQAAQLFASERFVATNNNQHILRLLAEQARLGARPGRAA
jgi:glycosyltransferase involved in cell wall biosynthesis